MAQAAVHDFPVSIRLPLALGIAYFGRGRQTEAVKTFSETCQRFPDADLPVYYLANATDLAGETLAETRAVVAAIRPAPRLVLALLLSREIRLPGGD